MSADGESRLLARFKVGERTLNCVTWSPDGNFLVVASEDCTVRVLSLLGGERLCLRGHSDWVNCVAFSPDGKYIASGSDDKTARLWDSNSGEELHCLRGHEDVVFGVAFAVDGQTVATASRDSTCRLWSCLNQHQIATVRRHTHSVKAIVASADGQYFASGSTGEAIQLWNARNGEPGGQIVGHQDWVQGLAFSPDSTTLASASDDKTIRLWQLETGAELSCFTGHKDHVRTVAFAPSGHYLASGSDDNTVRLWHIATGTETACLNSHYVRSVAFSPDGCRLAVVSNAGTLCLWDTSDLAEPIAKSVADLPLNTWLARQAATLGLALPTAQIYDTWVPQLPGADGQGLLGVLPPEKHGNTAIAAIALSHDGRTLYRGTADGQVQAWDLRNGMMRWATHNHTYSINDLALSPDGAWLACAPGEKIIHVLNAENGQECFRLKGGDNLRSVAFSPNGARLVGWSWNHAIYLWETATRQLMPLMKGHQEWVAVVAISRDGNMLAFAAVDGSIRLSNYHSNKQHLIMHKQALIVYDIAFTPDDENVVAAFSDGSIRQLDRVSGKQNGAFVGHSGHVVSLVFSPDGMRLASGAKGERTNIKIWDSSSGTELQRFDLAEYDCGRLAWSGNGAFLVVGLINDTVRILDTRPSARNVQVQYSKPADTQSQLPPPAWLTLIRQWQLLQQLEIAAPLSLILELQALLAKDVSLSLQALTMHPGLHGLQRLNWPAQARIGILALVLHRWPGSTEWQISSNTNISEARNLLEDALPQSTPCEPMLPAPPLAWLTQALNQVDERLLTLLTVLGPQAVANDPGLPLRLLPELAKLPCLSLAQRHLLSVRIDSSQSDQSQGSGEGQDHSGLTNNGSITALLPSQWGYPRPMLRWQQRNGGLLYRAHSGRDAPQLRPMVILLDTSPACWGVVEALTRPAAHELVHSLLRHHRNAILLTADQKVHHLNQASERLQLLQHRSGHTMDIPATLAKAQALRKELMNGGLEPVILLLTHCWFGADLQHLTRQPCLRALFVQYPGAEKMPPFGVQCERWEALTPQQWADVATSLGRLST